EIELREDQINRWVAERFEWPEGERLDFAPLQQPYINLLDGDRVRLAVLVEYSGLRAVMSLTLRPAITGEQLLIRWEAVAAGVAPAPRSLVEDVVQTQLAASKLGQHMTPDGAIRIANEFDWPNGHVPCRVESIHVGDGAVRIRLVSLPRPNR